MAAPLRADLFLIHAPSVYDFRERDDLLFAYLSDSDSVNVTSIYEMYPIGFFALKQRLAEHGFRVEIVNIAALMLKHPDLDVGKLLAKLEAPVFGFDVHWMAQCHGAVELAAHLKLVRPDAMTIFGGISSTYFAKEMIRYPSIDVVVRGFDTLEPVTQMMEAIRAGRRDFSAIPNVVCKDRAGDTVEVGFTHKPMKNYNDATGDWSFYRGTEGNAGARKLIMSLPNTGCAFDCGWCGGSRFAYQEIMGVKKTLVQKDNRRVSDELRSMGEAAKVTSIYALQCYSETKVRLHEYLDTVKEMGYKSVHFEQFHLTPDDTLAKMADSTQSFIMLSPESHDLEISTLAGRGTYSMEQMETWIDKALDIGIAGVMIWFFIGMPKQDKKSVMDTVEYCGKLLDKYRGKNVLPLICPMVPFLDPGCRFFVHPKEHGYRIFHRSFEEHRRAMIAPLWHRRLNYETEWLSRRELQNVSYDAIGELVAMKGSIGLIPPSMVNAIRNTIKETQALLVDMERALDLDGVLPADMKRVIRTYNGKILAYSSDQIIPVPRPHGTRWFDDYTVPAALIESCLSTSPNRWTRRTSSTEFVPLAVGS